MSRQFIMLHFRKRQFIEVNAVDLLMEVDSSSHNELLQELNYEKEEHHNCIDKIGSKINELKQESHSVHLKSNISSKHSHSANRFKQNVSQKRIYKQN